MPVTGDYDGDGKADLAVYHSLTHRWQIKLSSDGLVIDREWGAKGDQPLAADYDGDGKADLAVWRAADSKLRVLSHERELNYAIDFETRGDFPLSGTITEMGRSTSRSGIVENERGTSSSAASGE